MKSRLSIEALAKVQRLHGTARKRPQRRQKQRGRLEREAREKLEADGQLPLAIGRDLGAEVFD